MLQIVLDFTQCLFVKAWIGAGFNYVGEDFDKLLCEFDRGNFRKLALHRSSTAQCRLSEWLWFGN